MPEPEQYSACLVYRLRASPEFLLFQDSFASHKHWSPPKGRILNNEEPSNAAIREIMQVTSLSAQQFTLHSRLKIDITYFSGEKAKVVHIFLARLNEDPKTTSNVKILPLAEGMKWQWCKIDLALEKVVYKSMKDALKQSLAYIESTPEANPNVEKGQKHFSHQRNLSNGYDHLNEDDGQLRQSIRTRSTAQHYSDVNSNSQNAHSQVSENPLYKTRLCERFLDEGNCPYGNKCHFAHGQNELRGRSNSANFSQQAPTSHFEEEYERETSPPHQFNNNNAINNTHLYKTKLCQRFMKDNYCQYGPKCHFAHGYEEFRQKTPTPINARPSRGTRTISNGGYSSSENTTTRGKRQGWTKSAGYDHIQENGESRVPTPPNEEDLLRDRVFVRELVGILNSNSALTDQVKEVTRMELRHNLTKLQLFQTLISSLFQKNWFSEKWNTSPCEQLLKAFVVTRQDQIVFLESWARDVDIRLTMQKRAKWYFKQMYDIDLIDEHTFLQWYDGCPDISIAKKKCETLAKWLRSVEEESE